MMKCPNCGHELNPNAKFCKKCGTSVSAPASAPQDDYESLYETMVFGPPKPFRAEPPKKEPVNAPSVDRGQPSEPAAAPRNRRAEFENLYAPAPPASAPTTPAPGASAKKKPLALIISIIALVLLIIIGASVILFVYPGVASHSKSSAAKVDAAEIKEAKDDFVPPAEAIQIDTSLADPSNDDIQFKFDERNRIVACSYTHKERTYDQSYTYNDAGQQVTIDTTYKENDIASVDISYSQVTAPDTFVTVDGYYLRLDAESLAGGTAASENRLTQGPQGLATEAPVSSDDIDWKSQYINYLGSIELESYSGKLIHLNDDDIPELIHFSGSGADTTSYRLCWIENGEVKHQDITGLGRFYLERTGAVKAVWSAQSSGSWTSYNFNGADLSEVQKGYWSYDSSIGEKQYTIDGVAVSEADYFAGLGDTSSWSNMAEDLIDKDNLPEYIRTFS